MIGQSEMAGIMLVVEDERYIPQLVRPALPVDELLPDIVHDGDGITSLSPRNAVETFRRIVRAVAHGDVVTCAEVAERLGLSDTIVSFWFRFLVQHGGLSSAHANAKRGVRVGALFSAKRHCLGLAETLISSGKAAAHSIAKNARSKRRGRAKRLAARGGAPARDKRPVATTLQCVADAILAGGGVTTGTIAEQAHMTVRYARTWVHLLESERAIVARRTSGLRSWHPTAECSQIVCRLIKEDASKGGRRISDRLRRAGGAT